MASVSERSYQFLFVVSQRQHQAAQHIWSQIGWSIMGCFSVRRADYVFDEAMICFMTDQWPNKSRGCVKTPGSGKISLVFDL